MRRPAFGLTITSAHRSPESFLFQPDQPFPTTEIENTLDMAVLKHGHHRAQPWPVQIQLLFQRGFLDIMLNISGCNFRSFGFDQPGECLACEYTLVLQIAPANQFKFRVSVEPALTMLQQVFHPLPT
jgi:hypothetical protein